MRDHCAYAPQITAAFSPVLSLIPTLYFARHWRQAFRFPNHTSLILFPAYFPAKQA
ncbi:hypothetical protein I2I11_12780 [Pontibacter sp. 172403-2]|uniref:hypothetical protein n=1 Tax=Pontibacter rufus TaxID=2791028 RepID=UPI0018AF69A9|nr:hypothetical protein [Pontibacter sp. 172403-2]MBF9254172.1 hypothetical protein [Pontibacter sp. 172403-2]